MKPIVDNVTTLELKEKSALLVFVLLMFVLKDLQIVIKTQVMAVKQILTLMKIIVVFVKELVMERMLIP